MPQPIHTTYETHILIDKTAADLIRTCLDPGPCDDRLHETETISKTVKFPDGRQMDIRLCGADKGPAWTEAVLFERSGVQVCCTDPDDAFFQVWEIESDGVKYVVDVRAAKF